MQNGSIVALFWSNTDVYKRRSIGITTQFDDYKSGETFISSRDYRWRLCSIWHDTLIYVQISANVFCNYSCKSGTNRSTKTGDFGAFPRTFAYTFYRSVVKLGISVALNQHVWPLASSCGHCSFTCIAVLAMSIWPSYDDHNVIMSLLWRSQCNMSLIVFLTSEK